MVCSLFCLWKESIKWWTELTKRFILIFSCKSLKDGKFLLQNYGKYHQRITRFLHWIGLLLRAYCFVLYAHISIKSFSFFIFFILWNAKWTNHLPFNEVSLSIVLWKLNWTAAESASAGNRRRQNYFNDWSFWTIFYYIYFS